MPSHQPTDQHDADLLNRFVRDRDDAAFAELVKRYAGLVYGVALRRAGRPLADEIVQHVFGSLARKAASLDAEHGLGAWLHKVTVRVSANVARKEQRRNRAMERYAETLGDGEPAPHSDLLPVLDDSLLALGGGERQLIMLRFFESLSFREIGQRIGATEEAGRKRVSRALDKLSDIMRRRAGRAVPAASLATLLGASLPTEAPAAVVTAAAASNSVAGSAFTAVTIMKTSQVAFATTLALAAAIPVAVQWHASASEQQAPPDRGRELAEKKPIASGGTQNMLLAASAAFRSEVGLDLNKLAAAIAQIDENGEPAGLLLELTAQMYALGESDINAVGDVLANAPNADHLRSLFDAYFSRWAEFDPRTALDATNSPHWKELAGAAQIEAAQTWAASDPEAAVEWCEAQEDNVYGSILKMCVFREWAIVDPHAALTKAGELPKDRALSYRKTLASVWVQHDPEGAMAWAQGLGDETERTLMIEKVLEEYSQQSAGRSVEMAKTIEDPILRRDTLRYAFMQWRFQPVESARGFLALPEADRTKDLAGEVVDWLGIDTSHPADPEQVLRGLVGNAGGDGAMKASHYAVGITVALIAGTLLGKALFPKPDAVEPEGGAVGRGPSKLVVSALPAGRGLGLPPEEVFAAIAEDRASPNPGRSQFEMRLKLRAMSDAEILELAERLVAGEFALTEYESFVLSAVWERYAALDPGAAYRDALLLETRTMRRDAVNIAVTAWALADPAGALAKFTNLPDTSPSNSEFAPLGTVLGVLVKNDPQNAIAKLDQFRDESWYVRARGSLFHSWWGIDAEAAREWLVEGVHDDPDSAARMLRSLAYMDSQDALDLAYGMERTSQLQHAVSDIVVRRMMWVEGDAKVAELKKVPAGWMSEEIAEQVGMNGVTETPLGELDAIAAAFPTEELRDEFWHSALGRRASDANFADAVALLQKLSPGNVRGEGAREVVTYWAKLNPAEASEWVAGLPAGAMRDGAAAGLARTIAPLDPESARRWAESIGDEAARVRALEEMAQP